MRKEFEESTVPADERREEEEEREDDDEYGRRCASEGSEATFFEPFCDGCEGCFSERESVFSSDVCERESDAGCECDAKDGFSFSLNDEGRKLEREKLDSEVSEEEEEEKSRKMELERESFSAEEGENCESKSSEVMRLRRRRCLFAFRLESNELFESLLSRVAVERRKCALSKGG